MSTALQSFNRSALGAFIQSNIDPNARGAGTGEGSLFIGGTFTTAGGESCLRLAYWDDTLLEWAQVSSTIADISVTDVILLNGVIYIGGILNSRPVVRRLSGSTWIDITPVRVDANLAVPWLGTGTRVKIAILNGTLYACNEKQFIVKLPDAESKTVNDKFSFTVNASTDVFTAVGHNFLDDDVIFFEAGSMPGGLNASKYYFASSVSGDTFKARENSGGPDVNVTSIGGAPRFVFRALLDWENVGGTDANPLELRLASGGKGMARSLNSFANDIYCSGSFSGWRDEDNTEALVEVNPSLIKTGGLSFNEIGGDDRKESSARTGQISAGNLNFGMYNISTGRFSPDYRCAGNEDTEDSGQAVLTRVTVNGVTSSDISSGVTDWGDTIVAELNAVHFASSNWSLGNNILIAHGDYDFVFSSGDVYISYDSGPFEEHDIFTQIDTDEYTPNKVINSSGTVITGGEEYDNPTEATLGAGDRGIVSVLGDIYAANTDIIKRGSPVQSDFVISSGGSILAMNKYKNKLLAGGSYTSLDGVSGKIHEYDGSTFTEKGGTLNGDVNVIHVASEIYSA